MQVQVKKKNTLKKKVKKLYDLINKRCIEWMVVQNTASIVYDLHAELDK